MEDHSNNKSRLDRLRAGEKVACNKCKIGIYKPINTTPDKAHGFYCDNCDNHLLIDPAVVVE